MVKDQSIKESFRGKDTMPICAIITADKRTWMLYMP